MNAEDKIWVNFQNTMESIEKEMISIKSTFSFAINMLLYMLCQLLGKYFVYKIRNEN